MGYPRGWGTPGDGVPGYSGGVDGALHGMGSLATGCPGDGVPGVWQEGAPEWGWVGCPRGWGDPGDEEDGVPGAGCPRGWGIPGVG